MIKYQIEQLIAQAKSRFRILLWSFSLSYIFMYLFGSDKEPIVRCRPGILIT